MDTAAEPDIALSSQHLVARSVQERDEDGVRRVLFLGDGEQMVAITMEMGDDKAAARRILEAATVMAEHAHDVLYRERMRTMGWT